MSPLKTFTTAGRVLKQLKHDPRTIGLIIGIPVLLMTLLKFVYEDSQQIYGFIAPILIGFFPLLIMFLVTSIATLRERNSGTLDRLMTMPISKLDLVFGYALAFSFVGFVQALVVSTYSIRILGVSVSAGSAPLILVAIIAAFLGTAMGLFVSAFAKNEFQAVQLVMPTLMPQFLISGLLVPREDMATMLETISNFLPLTYMVEAAQIITKNSSITSEFIHDILILLGFGIIMLVLGTITIKRAE